VPTEELDELEAEIETELEALVDDEPGTEPDADAETDADGDEGGSARRRRRRGGRGRRRRTGSDLEGDDSDAGDEAPAEESSETDGEPATEGDDSDAAGTSGSSRRRRRRRRGGDGDSEGGDEPRTTTRVREPRVRSTSSEVTSVKGSTRLEAKKQRRREGREAGRRRPSILTEAEFLARREAVDRVMIVRQREDRTQIAVLEDGVLVEHYVNRSTGGSMIGNVYLGKVQNVLPSMEAAFVDVGRGRNAVLYAGEVNWDAAGMEGQQKRIETALKSGDTILVQVSKDPLGHKGARLTGQISLPGRFLVYVPEGSMTGISRKLPDTERARLKSILRQVVPEGAGVIVRTAAEGASEEELRRDVERLAMQWADIQSKAAAAGVNGGPALLHGEPDLAIKVVRDIFNEDFGSLVVEGDSAWHDIESYVTGVAPDLADRLHKWVGPGDLFQEYRVDEQLAKALDRKVWLPSGGSLVIDRTEAMTVVDVNTGKFTGQGGNLEETVTKNNLEAAEEIVRQLRLRDIGGIVVVDFIDMVLENNRDLVLRRLIECLGRDRTKHQVAEVTSLGLVQMTRKRIGQGLLEVFSEPCEACQGRGYHVHSEPVVAKAAAPDTDGPVARSGRRRKGSDGEGDSSGATDDGSGEGKPKARKRGSKAAGSSATPEVAVKAVDPAVSAAMEKVHAAAAKRAADAAAAAGEPAPASESEPAPDRAPEAPAEAVEAPAAPARRARGSRKAGRPAGPAAAAAVAATEPGPDGGSPDVTGATTE
jgi:ribonuclease E